MTVVDRHTLGVDVAGRLAASGHLVGVNVRPDGAGRTDGGGFVPYGVVYTQHTVPVAALSSSAAGARTTVQVTAVGDDPEVTSAVARDLGATVVGWRPATVGGRYAVQVRPLLVDGPHRDPQDRHVWYAFFRVQLETW